MSRDRNSARTARSKRRQLKAAPLSAANAAKAALADAQDEVASARAAHAKLTARLPDLQDSLLDNQNRVVAAADRVLQGAAARALADAEAASLRVRELLPVLRFLVRPEVPPDMAGRAMARRS
jgi:hypothetical protein